MKKLKPSEPLEKEIETSILQYLSILPECFAFKNQSIAVFDPTKKTFRKAKSKFLINGTSDILGVFRGKFLAIEVKRPSNKVRSADQDNFIENIKIHGGVAFYATSIEDVKAGLGL
jgi:penicillin-binding protein-related factor A (putative recombinase)